MDKFSELKAVAEKAKELAGINNYKKGKDAIAAFKAAANPAAILALLADNERLARELVARNGENEWLRKRAAELEHANKSQDDHINQQQDRIESLEKTNTELGQRLGAAEKRIIELDYLRLSACEVFKEIGNELGCNHDNESIMMAIDELKAIRAAAEKLVRCKGRYHSEQNYRALAELFGVTTPDLPPVEGDSEAVITELRAKLATPVVINLPERRDDSYDWDGASPSEAFNTCRSICGLMFRQQLRAAGFTVGDE